MCNEVPPLSSFSIHNKWLICLEGLLPIMHVGFPCCMFYGLWFMLVVSQDESDKAMIFPREVLTGGVWLKWQNRDGIQDWCLMMELSKNKAAWPHITYLQLCQERILTSLLSFSSSGSCRSEGRRGAPGSIRSCCKYTVTWSQSPFGKFTQKNVLPQCIGFFRFVLWRMLAQHISCFCDPCICQKPETVYILAEKALK